MPDLPTIRSAIISCDRCTRLRTYCDRVARDKKAAHRDDTYWGRPVPGFGDPAARVLVLGLAPAAHGGNRTGRVFTGDASGDFLWAAMHEVGLADQPSSRRADDGLTLLGAYVAAAVRCAPPANRPTPAERDTCAPFLTRELAALEAVRVIVPLGAFGWEAAFRAIGTVTGVDARPRPRFGHGAEARAGGYTIVGSYHPSQQNTFTGRLTMPMLVSVLNRARDLAESSPGQPSVPP
jgi:uracil-DNA glycosylase family 4